MRRWSALAGLGLLLLGAGCRSQSALSGQAVNSVASVAQAGHVPTLLEARAGFTTRLVWQKRSQTPPPRPPAEYELVHYDAPLGSFPAYVTKIPGGGKHPAIVWIAGGFDNGIDRTPWAPATPDNDQSARAFPQAGIVTMYPSLRGGNGNPGYFEGFYGEVNDVIAAAQYLATRPDVDPTRIYLGGHSTGGTLALLVAESTGMFRSVFAFGPMDWVGYYDSYNLPFSQRDRKEMDLRSPTMYLDAITSPTYAMEGIYYPANTVALHRLLGRNKNPQVHFYDLPHSDHFNALATITPVIARAIVADTGPTANIQFAASSRDMRLLYP